MIRAYSVVALVSAFLVYWFGHYLTAAALPSVDLPGHISLFEYLSKHQLSPLGFYDPRFFGGYPALTFYGPLPALITVVVGSLLGITVQHSANILLVCGLSLFPFAVLYATIPFYKEILGGRSHPWLLGLWTGAVSFWFVNHDSQWHGIGAAAITNIGLYSQLFAWFPLLLIVGLVGREILNENSSIKGFAARIGLLSTVFGLLFYTHSLTFAFASGYVIFLGAFRRSFWFVLAPFLGLILALPYSYYFLSNVSEYAPFDIYAPKGDMLGILYRYAPVEILDAIVTAVNSGIVTRFSALELLLYPLTLIVLMSRVVHGSKLFFAQLIVVISAALITSSDFMARGFGLSLHYYRFISLNLVLLLPIIISSVFLCLSAASWRRTLSAVIGGFGIAAFVTQIGLPHYERKRVMQTAQSPYLIAENSVVEKMLALPKGSRVITEYFSDYTKFPFLGAHYIESQMVKTGRIEAAGGLFVQSAPTYKLASGYLEGLGADTYHVSQQITPAKHQTPGQLAQGLIKLGVTHVLGVSEKLQESLKAVGAVEIFKQGRYFLFELAKPQKISQITVPIIGYIDLKGSLPFRMLDQFYAEDPERFYGYELVELLSLEAANLVDFVLINSASSDLSVRKPYKVIDFNEIAPLWHYRTSNDLDRELVKYKRVREYLKGQKIQKLVIESPLEVSVPQFDLSESGQEIAIKYLVPGARYRISYSYFPFWKGAGLMRGAYNQMVLFASNEEVDLKYR